MANVELIRRRRAQMLIHSYLYYWLSDSIISDHLWQKWADELTELQKETKEIGFYDEAFSDWNGTTGCHLPKDEYVANKAMQISRLHFQER